MEQLLSIFENFGNLSLGMVGIFVVTGIIIGVIYALSYFTNKERKSPDESQDN